MPDLGPLGHSRPAHRAHGWCSHCPGRTVEEELAAWQVREDALVADPPDRRDTELQQLRAQLAARDRLLGEAVDWIHEGELRERIVGVLDGREQP